VISVCKSIRTFEYQPGTGSFKAWLLRLTAWRIADQFRKRQRAMTSERSRDETRTATVERIEDPSCDLESIWDEEWRTNLMEAAMERVKRRIDNKQYQIYDLYVQKHLPVARVSCLLGVTATQVYLAKHRVLAMVRKEIKDLETQAAG
jgi:RNA polymerase sigma-70 factor (ECF subfamily)